MNCTKCGKELASNASFCEYCGHPVQQPQAETAPAEKPQKPENLVTGIVGAFLGALIGGGVIIGLSQLGYVASLSGLILAVCTLKGYELLGGRLSKKGILVCILLMLVTPYIADRLDWAIVVLNAWGEYGITFGEAYAIIPELIADGTIELGEYLKNLLMIYGFAVLGALSTLATAFKNKKK